MNGRLLLRILIVFGLAAWTLGAASVALNYNATAGHQGDFRITSAPYFNTNDVIWFKTQGAIIGGVLDTPTQINSTAVEATNRGVTSWSGATPATFTSATLEGFLALTQAEFEAKLLDFMTAGTFAGDNIGNGSAIYWTGQTLNNGDTIDFNYSFVANDSIGAADDFAFLSISNGAGIFDIVLLDSVTTVTDMYRSNATAYSYLYTGSSSTFTIGLGVMNAGYYFDPVNGWFDNDPASLTYDPSAFIQDSALLLDPGPEVPEPGTWLLVGAGTLLAAVSRRRKK